MALLRVAVLCLGYLGLCSAPFGQTMEVYQGPVPIRLKETTFTLPITVMAEPVSEDAANILLHAFSSTTDLRPILREQLQTLAREKARDCELRISVPDTNLGLESNLIVLTTTIRSEFWLCTSFLKTRLGRDTMRVTASVIPSVRDGRLHLEPGQLHIEDLGDLIAAIGGEQELQGLYRRAIDRFNNDDKMTLLPEQLLSAGFAYHSVALAPEGSDPTTLRLSIKGPNDLLNLIKIITGMK